MIYLDTSALAKNYIKEDGSDSINKIIADSPVIAISKITYPEILSALIRRNKTGDISNRELIKLTTEFESNWDYFVIVDFKDELLPLIKTVIQKHLLKAADAIHLSSALWLKNAARQDVTFVASDKNLLNAAQNERLQIINPQNE